MSYEKGPVLISRPGYMGNDKAYGTLRGGFPKQTQMGDVWGSLSSGLQKGLDIYGKSKMYEGQQTAAIAQQPAGIDWQRWTPFLVIGGVAVVGIMLLGKKRKKTA